MHKISAPLPCTPQPEIRVCYCGWGLGTPAQASEVRPRERTRLGRVEGAWRGGTMATEGIFRRTEGLPERQGAVTAAAYKQRWNQHKSTPPGHLLQDPEVGTGCCYRTREQAPNTAPAVLGALEERPPLGDLQAGVQGAAMLSWEYARAAAPAQPISRGQTASTHWGKRKHPNRKQALGSGKDGEVEGLKHTSSHKNTKITT